MWTPALESELIRVWNEGKKSASQIADTFGPPFTRNSVVAKVWRMRRDGVFLRSNPTREQSNPRIIAGRAKRYKAGLQAIQFDAAAPAADPPRSLPPDTGKPLVRDILTLENHHCR